MTEQMTAKALLQVALSIQGVACTTADLAEAAIFDTLGSARDFEPVDVELGIWLVEITGPELKEFVAEGYLERVGSAATLLAEEA